MRRIDDPMSSDELVELARKKLKDVNEAKICLTDGKIGHETRPLGRI